ncbi:MAG: hypothetical protein K2K21_10765, partial [Lachnospiraceae bacterium]|nr:hypothetical protein [Lachnospiraceae bacterium]
MAPIKSDSSHLSSLGLENILENILTEGFRKGILKDNRLAGVLLNTVKSGTFFTSSRRALAASLVASPMPEGILKDIGNMHSQKKNSLSDLRFVGVSISGIKKYPPRSNIGYGLSFSMDGEPINSVFVGSNGVGKTSMYAALEYAGMRKVNTAMARGYKRKTGQSPDRDKKPEEDQSEFLLHCGAEIKDIFLNLFTESKEIKLAGEDIINQSGKAVVSEVFYCSDYDVHELETTDDYTRFMLRQIGLNHLYH